MSSVCFYFQVHQPYRLNQYRVFDIGDNRDYFSTQQDQPWNNQQVFNKVAEECYLKTNDLLYSLLEDYQDFRLSFSLSGVFLDQAEEFNPEVLASFKNLISHPRVEILTETYYHSLSFLYSIQEFKRQIKLHHQKINRIFGESPQVFRNTELIYNDQIAQIADELGFNTVLAEGAPQLLNWRSPNFVYKPKDLDLKLLLKNFQLSDDIAFRFSRSDWGEFPLTAGKFARWIDRSSLEGEVVNLFMDYETFGEHQWEDTGIFNFLEHLPSHVLDQGHQFLTPSQLSQQHDPRGELSISDYVSWADIDRDLSAWCENELQQQALEEVYTLEEQVLDCNDDDIKKDWRKLQISDHFYYMCTKWFEDGDVHAYFNPYDSPYDAFIIYMNVLRDLKHRIKKL